VRRRDLGYGSPAPEKKGLRRGVRGMAGGGGRPAEAAG
jgi:hypothetical protein